VAQYREAVRVPGFLVVGVESAVYFANSMYLVERVMRYLRDEEERALKSNHPSIRCVVLDMGGELPACFLRHGIDHQIGTLAFSWSILLVSPAAVAAIDTSGLDALSELKKVLDKRNIEVQLPPLAVVLLQLLFIRNMHAWALMNFNLQLVLANPVGSVAERMFNSAVGESFGSGRLFFSVAEAVAAGACKAAQPWRRRPADPWEVAPGREHA
jgi:sulfate transporter 3